MASAQCNSSNSILSLKETPFGRRNNEDKLATIQLGPPRPNITIKQVATKKGKSYTRGFSKNWYQRKSWLAGCEVANAVFCYPCLLFHPEGSMTDSTAWTTTGVKDMHHLSEKVKKTWAGEATHRQLSEVLWFWEGEHCHSTGWGIQASSTPPQWWGEQEPAHLKPAHPMCQILWRFWVGPTRQGWNGGLHQPWYFSWIGRLGGTVGRSIWWAS